MPICPSCELGRLKPFWHARDVPVHSVLLMRSAGEARACVRGDIELAFCPRCGYVGNTAFDDSLMRYARGYESTQACSTTFDRFHRRLAAQLVARYSLPEKRIVEIGCGNGEFLHLLRATGAGPCVGFDPAYNGPAETPGIFVVQDVFDAQHPAATADFYVCKMTLEHIAAPRLFLGKIRKAIADRHAAVYCQVPNAMRILQHGVFWDVYYEHCSYFGAVALSNLFESTGFNVRDVHTGYAGQYLMLEAVAETERTAQMPETDSIAVLADMVEQFPTRVRRQRAAWADTLGAAVRPMLWGGGSKAVAFLTEVGEDPRVEHVVDINPRRQGTFLPGSGQEIIAPTALRSLQPDLVVIMNPVYRGEIKAALAELGLSPKVVALEDAVDP